MFNYRFNNMNILIINHYAGGPTYGMEFRPYYLGQCIAKKGHKAYVLGADQSHLRKAQPECIRRFSEERIDSVNFRWLKSSPYSGNNLGRFKNICSFLRQCISQSDEILKWSKPDVVVASSTYPLDNYIARWYAKKCGAKFIYEVHDLWPLTPVEIGAMSKWHPFILLLQHAENYGYKHATQVISILPATLLHMIDHGLEQDKFHFIPNGIYLDEALNGMLQLPAEHQRFLNELKTSGKAIIGYAGGHALSNCLDNLIDAAKELTELNFVLVGNGVEKPRLIKRTKSESIDNVYFLDPVAKPSVQSLLSNFDILTLVWNKSSLYRFGVSSNKVFDYMLAGKPIVQALSAPDDPVTLSRCGLTTPAGDVSSLISSFINIARMPIDERILMGERGREYVLKHHNYCKLANDFLLVCKK